jgi:6-phosphogluconolactonase
MAEPKPMKLMRFDAVNEKHLWDSAHSQVLESIRRALETKEEVCVGLAGGSTPKPIYERLAQEALPWERITWVLLDERYVPTNDSESNLGMIQEIFFDPARVPQKNRIFFDTSLSPEQSALAMSEAIAGLEEKGFPLFDLLILGAGSDGHIASLFGAQPESLPEEKAFATTAPQQYTTKNRLTLSLSTLTNSKEVILILKGAEKKQVLSALEKEEETAQPMLALKRLSQTVPMKIFTYFAS